TPRGGDAVVMRVPPPSSVSGTARFDTAGLPRAVICQVRVRVAGEDSFGAWSLPVSVALIAPPSSLEVSFEGQTIKATWPAVPGATGYRFDLVTTHNEVVFTEKVDATTPADIEQLGMGGVSRAAIHP